MTNGDPQTSHSEHLARLTALMLGALLSPPPGSSRIFDALLAEQGAAADGTSLRAMDRYAEADSGKPTAANSCAFSKLRTRLQKFRRRWFSLEHIGATASGA